MRKKKKEKKAKNEILHVKSLPLPRGHKQQLTLLMFKHKNTTFLSAQIEGFKERGSL